MTGTMDFLGDIEIPDGKDFPTISMFWERVPQTNDYALTFYTDRLPGQVKIRIVDAWGTDHICFTEEEE